MSWTQPSGSRRGEHGPLSLGVLDDAAVQVAVFDGDDRLVYANTAAACQNGYALDDLIGKPWPLVIVDSIQREAALAAFELGPSWDSRYRHTN